MPVREGLGRLDGVEFVSKLPDLKTATCELRLRNGRLVDPTTLSNHIYEIRVGARLRGLEATIDGQIEARGGNCRLRPTGTNALIELGPLSKKVQQHVPSKTPQPVTSGESRAFAKLLAKVKRAPRSAQVTGPLVRRPDGTLLLEVRTFKLN